MELNDNSNTKIQAKINVYIYIHTIKYYKHTYFYITWHDQIKLPPAEVIFHSMHKSHVFPKKMYLSKFKKNDSKRHKSTLIKSEI